MPDPIRITVCVVALTQSDYDELDPAIRAKLTPPAYDFTTAGKPYAASPDEWQPFDTGVSIRKYLAEANFAASFLSSHLYDNPEVLKKTHLYIIDPFVLAHTKKRDQLAREIQTTIFVSDRAFCIILPEDLPKPLRTEITNMCITSLSNLYSIRTNNDSYEWRVEDDERLRGYLQRLARHLGPKPDPGQLNEAKVIFLTRGVRDLSSFGLPSMVP